MFLAHIFMLFSELSLCHLSQLAQDPEILRWTVVDTYTFMFDEKEEDKGVADYSQCPHNNQENEAGKKNLKIVK